MYHNIETWTNNNSLRTMEKMVMLMLMIDLFWMLMLYLISIPLDKTSDICVNKLFQNTKTLFKGNSKTDFFDLLNLANKESFFFYINSKCCYEVFYRYTIGQNFSFTLWKNWLNKSHIWLYDLNQVFIESMLILFLYFFTHLLLPICFANKSPLNTRA